MIRVPGAALARPATGGRSIEVLPRACAIQSPHADAGDVGRVEVARVDAHAGAGGARQRVLVGDTAARPAANERERPVAPRVALGRATVRDHADLRGPVVRPQRAVAAADRAVAARQPSRPPGDAHLDGAAVAAGRDHRSASVHEGSPSLQPAAAQGTKAQARPTRQAPSAAVRRARGAPPSRPPGTHGARRAGPARRDSRRT